MTAPEYTVKCSKVLGKPEWEIFIQRRRKDPERPNVTHYEPIHMARFASHQAAFWVTVALNNRPDKLAEIWGYLTDDGGQAP